VTFLSLSFLIPFFKKIFKQKPKRCLVPFFCPFFWVTFAGEKSKKKIPLRIHPQRGLNNRAFFDIIIEKMAGREVSYTLTLKRNAVAFPILTPNKDEYMILTQFKEFLNA